MATDPPGTWHIHTITIVHWHCAGLIMGEFRGINKYGVVFLALLACHEVVLTHGRLQIKTQRPTAPGNSPGVGHQHKHMTMKTKVVVHRPEFSVTAATTQGHENDFRPTVPGPSPGVGHAFQHKIGGR